MTSTQVMRCMLMTLTEQGNIRGGSDLHGKIMTFLLAMTSLGYRQDNQAELPSGQLKMYGWSLED